MQVSMACTEHNLKSRLSDDRLCGVRSSSSAAAGGSCPSGGQLGNGSGHYHHPQVKGRTAVSVAVPTRNGYHSLAHLPIFLKETTGRSTGMKYR
ncbi:Voltage-gated potassium channel subunit beta-3 [Acipenser ruthenus]|uniref:Voltage-gated potassium channel subunit beta-3 n=2 Tax=Acipenseridae TaxID=7900 RepID=A0A444V4P7_ACIRT|nr:Voltage-gated potassium channel subunit beta-3 [Acipenser ruthenus]